MDVPGEVVGVIPCALSLQSAARSTQVASSSGNVGVGHPYLVDFESIK